MLVKEIKTAVALSQYVLHGRSHTSTHAVTMVLSIEMGVWTVLQACLLQHLYACKPCTAASCHFEDLKCCLKVKQCTTRCVMLACWCFACWCLPAGACRWCLPAGACRWCLPAGALPAGACLLVLACWCLPLVLACWCKACTLACRQHWTAEEY